MIGIELKYASVIPGVQCVTPGLGASNTQASRHFGVRLGCIRRGPLISR